MIFCRSRRQRAQVPAKTWLRVAIPRLRVSRNPKNKENALPSLSHAGAKSSIRAHAARGELLRSRLAKQMAGTASAPDVCDLSPTSSMPEIEGPFSGSFFERAHAGEAAAGAAHGARGAGGAGKCRAAKSPPIRIADQNISPATMAGRGVGELTARRARPASASGASPSPPPRTPR